MQYKNPMEKFLEPNQIKFRLEKVIMRKGDVK